MTSLWLPSARNIAGREVAVSELFDQDGDPGDPRAVLRRLAGDTTSDTSGSAARATLRALADDAGKEPTLPSLAPVVVMATPPRPPARTVRAPTTPPAQDTPGVWSRTVHGIGQAIEETVRHPLRTAQSLIEAPLASAYAALAAPVEGERRAESDYLRGKGIDVPNVAPYGEIITRENTPGAITHREMAEGALQTIANVAAGPIAGKVAGVASPVIGRTLGGLAGGATAGALVNTAYTPDDPAVGALSGAALGTLFHLAGEGVGRGVNTVVKTARTAASNAGEVVRLRQQLGEMAEARNVAERDANTDGLTGVANANAYRKALPTAETDPRTAIVRFDVNNFKAVNDIHGHEAGDAALRDVATAIQSAATEYGSETRVFRVGGDEFAALVPAEHAEAVRNRAEELYGIRTHGEAERADPTRTSISGGYGLTDADADASAYTRKQEQKSAQGMGERNTQPPSGVVRVPTAEIAVDPERFQFKRNVDPTTGASTELKNVPQFNEQLGGIISVWRDPADGRVYVVNGHHRVELAQRTNHPALNAQFIDTPTAESARAVGAMMNIAEGRGTPLDAAKFMRDSGVDANALREYGVSLTGNLARQGTALAKLAPDIFNRVARGEVSEGHGAAIGDLLEDPSLQRAAVQSIQSSGKRLTDAEVREVARQVRDAGTESVTQETLFGAEEEKRALIVERAQLASAINKRLAADKRIFGYVTRDGRATELARGGNVIDVATSRQLASESARLEELFGTLYTRSGPVSQILTEGARRIAHGETPTRVVDALYPEIRQAVSEAVAGRGEGHGGPLADGPTVGGTAPGEPGRQGGDYPGRTDPAAEPPGPAEALDPDQVGFLSPTPEKRPQRAPGEAESLGFPQTGEFSEGHRPNVPSVEAEPLAPQNAPTRFGARVRKLLGRTGQAERTDVKALIKISRGLADAVNVPLSQGRFRAAQRRALGVFFTRAETTRVVRFDRLDVVAHEVGHYISKKYLGNPTMGRRGGQIVLTKAAKLELETMGRNLYGNRTPAGGYGEEGIAEWTKFYVTDPERMQREAPMFTQAIQPILDREPTLKAALQQAQVDHARYKAAPANARVSAMISVNERVRNVPTVRQLLTSWLDDLNEFRVAMQDLGGSNSPRKDAYTLARLTRGAAGAAEEMIERGVVDFKSGKRVTGGIAEVLQHIPPERVQAFREYLIAERALEKWQQGIDTGITRADAAAVAEAGRAEFNEAAKALWDHSNALLRYRRDAGLLTPDEYQVIASKNERRVGFYRVFDDRETAASKGWGRAMGRNSSGVQSMKGSARVIVDPLESVLTDTYKTVQQAQQHHAAVTLLKIALKTEGGGRIAEKVPAPMKPTSVELEQVKGQLMDLGIELSSGGLEDYSGVYLTGFENMKVPGPGEIKDLVIPVFENGERSWVAIRDKRLYEALQGLNREEMTGLMRMLSAPARTLRAGATLTPEFIGRNPVRDMWSAAVYSQAGGLRIPGWDFSKGLFHYLKADEVFQRWKLEGGDNAAMLGLDRPQVQKALNDYLRTSRGKAVDVVRHPIDTLRMLSSAMENATRIGEFAAVEARELKSGRAARDASTAASLASRDVSIDFARAGTKSRAINSIVSFFNANLQSTEKLVRELRTRPHVVIPRALATITLPSVALYLAQKDDPAYQEIPRWQKDVFWIVIDRDEQGALQHIWRIPKPFELGVIFGTGPERILEYLGTHDREALTSAGAAITKVFTPPVVPTALTPLIENFANRSTYTDRPIVPRTTEQLAPGLQAGPHTGEAARALGTAVGYSPAKIENAVRGYTGGLGEYVTGVADAAVRAERSARGLPPLAPASAKTGDLLTRLPLTRGFTGREPGPDAESVERLFRAFESAAAHRRTWRALRTQGRIQEANAYLARHRDDVLSVATREENGGTPGPLRQSYEALGEFRDARKEVLTTPGADKETRLRSLDRRLVDFARRRQGRSGYSTVVTP